MSETTRPERCAQGHEIVWLGYERGWCSCGIWDFSRKTGSMRPSEPSILVKSLLDRIAELERKRDDDDTPLPPFHGRKRMIPVQPSIIRQAVIVAVNEREPLDFSDDPEYQAAVKLDEEIAQLTKERDDYAAWIATIAQALGVTLGKSDKSLTGELSGILRQRDALAAENATLRSTMMQVRRNIEGLRVYDDDTLDAVRRQSLKRIDEALAISVAALDEEDTHCD